MARNSRPPKSTPPSHAFPSMTTARFLRTDLATPASLFVVLVVLLGGGLIGAGPTAIPSAAVQSPNLLVGPARESVPALASAHLPFPQVSANNSSCNWTGLSHWVKVTSGSARGPAPWNVTWEVAVRGGTPPYNITSLPGDGSREFGANVTHTFVRPGIYEVAVWIVDSSTPCLAGGDGFEAYAWGPGGPNPAHFNVSTAGGPAPLTVHYSVNVTGLPANATINWTCFDGNGYGFWSGKNGPTTAWTYYMNGTVRVDVYIYYPDGGLFWDGWGPTANVTGPSLLSLNVTPQTAFGSANVTGWVNSTNASQLPLGYSFAGSVWPGTVAPCDWWNSLNFTPVLSQPFHLGPLVFPRGCAPAWSNIWGWAYYSIDVALFNGNQSPVAGLSALVQVLPTPAEHSSPVISFAITPNNGTAPLNVTLQTSAVGGTPPYQLQVGTVTESPPNSNGSRSLIYSFFVNQSAWDGSSTSTTRSFPVGDYRTVAVVTDANGNATIAWGYVSVQAPPVVPPLAAAAQVQNVGAPPSLSATFQANISGGAPPYSIEWTFGDGAVGSSRNAAPVTHPYETPGTYVVGLSARDSAGHSVERTLTVVIPPVVRSLSSPASVARPPGIAWLVGAGLLGGAILAGGGWWVHRRRLADGSALVRAMVAESARRPGQPPFRR